MSHDKHAARHAQNEAIKAKSLAAGKAANHLGAEGRAKAFLDDLIENIETMKNEAVATNASVADLAEEVEAAIAHMRENAHLIAKGIAHGFEG